MSEDDVIDTERHNSSDIVTTGTPGTPIQPQQTPNGAEAAETIDTPRHNSSDIVANATPMSPAEAEPQKKEDDTISAPRNNSSSIIVTTAAVPETKADDTISTPRNNSSDIVVTSSGPESDTISSRQRSSSDVIVTTQNFDAAARQSFRVSSNAVAPQTTNRKKTSGTKILPLPKQPKKPKVHSTDKSETTAWNHGRALFFYVVAVLQIAILILFGFLVDYSDGAPPGNTTDNTTSDTIDPANMDHYYPLYQDVHVMIFIGFGFLMTFLQKYGFSSVGYNFVIAALCIQWSLIVNGISHKLYEDYLHPETDHFATPIQIGIENLITSDFAAGSVLITFGAVLGKTSPTQMMVVAILEIIFYAFNEVLGAQLSAAVDMGGSMYVHMFGAYFGLALSKMISKPKEGGRKLNSSVVSSDMFAMVGTLFLWMFWPSFNGALATDAQQVRVVVNTVLALTASCLATFVVDAAVRPGHKFDMVSIQNATLAGGVAVGSSSDLVIQPYAAIIIGAVAGTVSVLGYVYMSPFLEKTMGLDDTCGVHNLHGLPGLIGALGGVFSAWAASDAVYGEDISTVFGARAPCPADVNPELIRYGCGRTASEQAQFQAIALITTLCVALFGGFVTGAIIKIPCLVPANDECKLGENGDEESWYQDKYYWEVPEEAHED